MSLADIAADQRLQVRDRTVGQLPGHRTPSRKVQKFQAPRAFEETA